MTKNRTEAIIALFVAMGVMLLLCLAARADSGLGTRVPLPTAAGQIPVSVSVGGTLTYQPVGFLYSDGVHTTFGGGTASTTSVLTANVVNTADGGLRVNLPSGATGLPIAVYSSTGVLLYKVAPSGAPSSSLGIPYNEIYGQGATGGGTSVQGLNTAFGNGAKAGTLGTSNDLQNCAFGFGANATFGSTCVGQGATAGSVGTAIGLNANAAGNNSFALGRACSTAASSQGSIALGFNCASTGPNQFVVGGVSGYGISQAWIGDGITNTVPTNTAINATGGSGTNIAGASMTLAGGQSTGTGAEGSVYLATSGSGTAGTALNSLTNRVQVSQSGLTVLGAGTVNSPAYQVGGTAGYTGIIPNTFQSLNLHSGIVTGYINSAGTQIGNP